MQLSAKKTQELRARLANRKSFFGGALSTANASVASTYVPAKERERPEEPKAHAKRVALGTQQPKQAPSGRPVAAVPRRATAADYAAFEALSKDGPPVPTAKPSAASKPGSSSRPLTPPPRRGAMGMQGSHMQQPNPSRSHTPTLQHKAVAKAVNGRGKKGQVMRKFAVAPQAVGGPTQSQKASQAWAVQAQKYRNQSSTAKSATASPAGTTPPASASGVHRDGSRSAGTSGRPPAARITQQPSSRMSLQGKDLSRLPEWQRNILQKKLQEETRRKRQREEEDDLDGFVVDDEEGDWRQELKSITGYDPSRFKEDKDDRSMEADWRTIQAEERRSAKLGRTEDDVAEAEEAARQRAKAKRKLTHKS